MRTAPDFDEWVAARGRSLLRLAHVLTGSRHDAADLVEEALSRALPGWSRISELDDPDAHVRRLVVAADVSRWSRLRRPGTPILVDAVEPTGISIEVRDDVWHACQSLPADQRTALVLRFYEDLDDADIAALTGAREGTVRSRISGGVAALRSELGEPVTDVAQALRDALDEGAEDAPATTGLAQGARAKLRRRRARNARTAAVAGVAALVAASVPAAVALVEAQDASRPLTAPERIVATTAVDPSSEHRVDPIRTVTWRGITFVVPGEWERGAGTSWCARVRKPARVTPRISFPGDAAARIECRPRNAYGVTVAPAAGFDPAYDSGQVWQYDAAGVDGVADYPDGAWISAWYDEDWVITVATSHQPLTDRIAGSIGADQVDVNGCAVSYDDVAARGSVGPRGVGASLCLYTADGALSESERLTVRETAKALGALTAAPAADPGPPGDDCVQQEGWRVTLTPAGASAFLGLYGSEDLGSCRDGVESTAPEQDDVEMTPEVVAALGLDDLPGE